MLDIGSVLRLVDPVAMIGGDRLENDDFMIFM